MNYIRLLLINCLNGHWIFWGVLSITIYNPSLLADQNTNAISTAPINDKVCFEGWLPSANMTDTQCLKVSSCIEGETLSPPHFSSSECPAELNDALLSEDHFQAVIQTQSRNQTFREVVDLHSSESYALPEWLPAYNQVSMAGSTSMLGLHIWKVMDKFKKFHQGKVTNKNIVFFSVYLAGAAWHLLDMSLSTFSKAIPFIAHFVAHTIKLPLSVAARFYDCSCCGQVKNGHNIMVFYNTLVLVVMSIGYAFL